MSIKPEDMPNDWFDLPMLPMIDEFRIEFHALIVANHKLVLAGIDREEKEALEGVNDQDEASYHRSYFDDLRIAANNLAIVAIVTRLDHWVTGWFKGLKLNARKKEDELLIIKKMEALNEKIGNDGPVDIKFFEGIVTARDSVIHGDSKSNWYYKGQRWVVEKYRNGHRLEVNIEHVEEAVEKTVQQLTFYDEQIKSRKEP